MVVFGQKWLYLGKWLNSGKSDCIRAKVVVLGKSGCIRAKVVIFRKSSCIRAKQVVLVQVCSILGKVNEFGQSVVFGQRWF